MAIADVAPEPRCQISKLPLAHKIFLVVGVVDFRPSVWRFFRAAFAREVVPLLTNLLSLRQRLRWIRLLTLDGSETLLQFLD